MVFSFPVGPPVADLRGNASGGASTCPPVASPGASYSPGRTAALPSINAIQAERQRQIDGFGHTLQGDASAPLDQLPRLARDVLGGIADDIQFHKPRAQMRRRAIKAAALLVAFIDRLDAEEIV